MSANAHTPAPRLSLIEGDLHRPAAAERLVLAPSPQLTDFIAQAADLGLGATEAVRLGLERALLLRDGQFLGFDVESARRLLVCAAGAARPIQPLCGTEPAQVRHLSVRQPVPADDVTDGLTVSVRQQILTRARAHVPETALHAAGVEEMLAWEIAARLEGRPMGEWGLKVLALRKAGRRAA